MRYFVLSCAFLANTSFAQTWNLNDVSYLFPLPQNQTELNQLLKPSQNHLIPKKIYLKVPLMDATGNADALYTASRAIAIRVDPCGINEDTNECDPQVRIIWQVLKEGTSDHPYTSLDAGMHSFYRLSQTQMTAFLARLWNLKLENLALDPAINTHLKPLAVHPAFLNSTTKLPFESALTRLILKYCSEQNLIQVTVEQIQASFTPGEHEPDSASTWFEFSGILKTKGLWKSIAIPNLKKVDENSVITIQKIFNESTEKDSTGFYVTGARFSLLPVQESRDASRLDSSLQSFQRLDEVLSGRSWIQKDRALIEGSYQVLRRFQNPHLSNTKNLDCTSCHLASPAESFLNHLVPRFETARLADSIRYSNPRPNEYDLTNQTVVTGSTQIFRAFGYFRYFPAINQRVINESAESAEYLNSRAQFRSSRSSTSPALLNGRVPKTGKRSRGFLEFFQN